MAAVEDCGVIQSGWTTVHVRLTTGSHHAVHDAVESPPKMLKIADHLWLVLSFGQVVMDMQATAGVYSCTDILNDFQGFRKDAFNFIPQHGCRFNFEL